MESLCISYSASKLSVWLSRNCILHVYVLGSQTLGKIKNKSYVSGDVALGNGLQESIASCMGFCGLLG